MSNKKLTQFNRDEKLLLIIPALQTISDMFLGSFFISFIMQNATNQIVGVALYQLLFYTFIAIGFVFLAKCCKLFNKTTILNFYPVIKIILLLSIICLGKDSINYLIPLGILYGILAAFYNLPINSLTGEKVSAYKTSYFVGIKNSLRYIVKIVSPVVLGFFITENSYIETAYFLLFLSFFELFLPFFFTRSCKLCGEKPELLKFFKSIIRFPIIKKYLFSEIIRGFSTAGVLSTLITMYTIYLFHTDLNLGIFTSIFSIFSIIVSFTFGKYVLKKQYPIFIKISSLFILIALFSFVFYPNQLTFILYNFICATAIVLLNHISVTNTLNISKHKCIEKNHSIEFFVIRDIALFIGRWVAFTALMYVGVFGGQEYLKYYLIIVTLTIPVFSYISAKISPHIKGRNK